MEGIGIFEVGLLNAHTSPALDVAHKFCYELALQFLVHFQVTSLSIVEVYFWETDYVYRKLVGWLLGMFE